MPSCRSKDTTQHTQDADLRWQESTTDVVPEAWVYQEASGLLHFTLMGIPSLCRFFHFNGCYLCFMCQNSPRRRQRAFLVLAVPTSISLSPASLCSLSLVSYSTSKVPSVQEEGCSSSFLPKSHTLLEATSQTP